MAEYSCPYAYCLDCGQFCLKDPSGRCLTCGSASTLPNVSASPIDIPRCREPDYPPGGSYQSPSTLSAVFERRTEEAELNLAIEESFEMARSPSPKPASHKVWDSMKKDKYIALGESPSATCSICMEDFAAQDDVVRTQCCGGVVHHSCMESTLCVTPRCPFCRSESFTK